MVCSLVVVLALCATAVAKPTLPLPPAMPAATTTGHVGPIYYATYGDGPPVILLHGGMGNGDHFALQLPALVEAHRVIVIDSRGHGRSALPKQKLSYRVMAEDVVAVMDALKLERAALVGWSDGGSIALDVAINQPTRVSKLFVVGTNYDASGHKPRKQPSSTFAAYTAKCRADHARLGGTPETFQAMVTAMRPIWRSPGGFTKKQLASIQAPTLVALGEHDELITVEHVREMAKLIPNAKATIFPNASHFVMWQDPKAFNAALVEFLAAKE